VIHVLRDTDSSATMRLESRLSLQQEVGWDRETIRMARYLADSQSSPFIISSPSTITEQLEGWREAFPGIQPTYNVGSNPLVEVLHTIQSLSIPFLFNNKQQLTRLVDLGVDSEQLTFSSPLKMASHLRAAKEAGVKYVYCDSVQELSKIKKWLPSARIIIQLSCSSSTSSSQLGSESGAKLSELPDILTEASNIGLAISGLALSPESCPTHDPAEHLARVTTMVSTAKQALDLTSGQVTDLHLGQLCPVWLTASDPDYLDQLGAVLRESGLLETEGLNLTADATDLLVSGSITLSTKIVSVKEDLGVMVYQINEGVFGAFASNLATPGDVPVSAPLPLGGGRNRKGLTAKLLETNIIGPSGDGLDVVIDDIVLQKMEVGDWLLFPNMGNKDLTEFETGSNIRGCHTSINIKGLAAGDSGARPCPDGAWSSMAGGKTVQLEEESGISEGLRGEIVELGDTFIYDDVM